MIAFVDAKQRSAAFSNVPQSLDRIKGGGGSIKVGAVGAVGSLITRELESTTSSPQMQLNSITRLQTAPVSIPCGATPRRQQARKSLDEACSSANSKIPNNLTPEASRRSKAYAGSSRQVLTLASSDNISLDGTPNREKLNKKGPQLVDTVDL